MKLGSAGRCTSCPNILPRRAATVATAVDTARTSSRSVINAVRRRTQTNCKRLHQKQKENRKQRRTATSNVSLINARPLARTVNSRWIRSATRIVPHGVICSTDATIQPGSKPDGEPPVLRLEPQSQRGHAAAARFWNELSVSPTQTNHSSPPHSINLSPGSQCCLKSSRRAR